MTYSVSFRRHVLDLKERENLTFAHAAHRFSVDIASLVRWSKEIEPTIYRREKEMELAHGLPIKTTDSLSRFQWIKRFLANDLVDVDAVTYLGRIGDPVPQVKCRPP